MSKTLYEEALADARKLKEVAENNAKKAVEEAVLPRIRDLIERQLFEDLEGLDHDAENPVHDDVLLDLVGGAADSSASISPPDEEGKVTLDLDALRQPADKSSMGGGPVPTPVGTSGEPVAEMELSVESLQNMFADENDALKKVNESISDIEVDVKRFLSASKLIKESKEFHSKIEELIERIQDTYQYVQERLNGVPDKAGIEDKLEGFFKNMNGLKETTMKSVKDLMNEGDLTIKLTGVPEDLDVEDLGIDLITGDEEEDGDHDVGAGDEMGGSEELDLDAGNDVGGEPEDDDLDMEEMDMGSMNDNDVVEISESMLRSEIERMRRARLQREAADLDHPGNVKGSKIPVDDFGGGKDEGDPWLDGDVTTAEDDKGPTLHGEGLEELDEFDELEEADMGAGAAQNQEQGHTAAAQPNDQKESVIRMAIQSELKLQKEAYGRYKFLVAEAKKGKKGAKDKAKVEAEKVKKSKKKVSELKNRLGALKLQNEGVANRRPAVTAEGNGQVESLRAKLNEQNLFNAKLLATNKLLQNESLSTKQKGSAIERLDEAKTIREVKLVYESIVKALSSRRSLAEGAGKVIGSSSRASAPGSTLTEAVSPESDRWARLAGIK
jgi:hypothetical protein